MTAPVNLENPTTLILEHRGRRWLHWVVFLALVASVIYNLWQYRRSEQYFRATKATERFLSGSRSGPYKVAVIRVDGAIIDGEGFVKDQIDQVMEDKDVRAVVLRVDSPGGSVTASDYIYHHLLQLKEKRQIPLVVSMGGLAASGGYYISMAVGNTPNTIFAEPTTWTGSIGVIIPHYNVGGLMQQFQVEDDSIASHRLKSIGTPTRPMTEEEKAILQALVNDMFDRFKQIIQQGRPKFIDAPEQLSALATGQVYTAQQAIENGLVDKIGFLEDAVARATELAQLPLEQVRVVEYASNRGLLDLRLPVAVSADSQAGDLAKLQEWLSPLASPRAYYWYGGLPLGVK